MNYLLVAIGGAMGASLRFAVMNLCIALRMVAFPYATMLVNIVGSFFIGLLAFYLLHRFANNIGLRLFLLVGLLGGFTTFSAFSLDTLTLINSQRYLASLIYIVGSVVLSIAAAAAGMFLANKIR